MADRVLSTPLQKRHSGVELLKLIAMVLIVCSHAMPTTASASGEHTMNLGLATTSLQRFVIVLMQYGGQVGNGIFIAASAWFLVGSRKVRLEKVLCIIGDTVAISVLSLVVFLLCGYPLDSREIARQFLPITMGANWFVVCYLLFYLIHPVLNMAVDALNARQLRMVCITLAVLYCGVNLLTSAYYYNNLVGFICVFFFAACLKRDMPIRASSKRFNRWVLALSAAGLLALIAGTNLLGLRIAWFSDKMTQWNRFTNPLILLIAFSSLNLARGWKLESRAINELSSLSLLIYVIHGNRLVMDHLKQDYFRCIYHTHTYSRELLWVLLAAGVLLAGGVLLAWVYRHTVQKPVYGICRWIGGKIAAQWTKK